MHLKKAFVNGRLLVGDGRIIDKANVIINENRIAEVGRNIEISGVVETLDCTGKTIMPGLFDCHLHLFNSDETRTLRGRESYIEKATMLGVRNAKATLDAGFTTIKEAGAPPYLNIYLRDMINSGWVTGPRIVACGFFAMTGGHGGAITGVDGADNCRRVARDYLAHNADIIKVAATGGVDSPTAPGAPQYTVDEMAAAFDEAHKVGKTTCCHAYGAEGIKNAIHAGVDCIDHGNLLDNECIDLMVKKRIFLIPTVALRPIREHKRDVLPKSVWEKSMFILQYMRETKNMEKAFRAGVKVAFGTDWPEGYGLATHGDNAEEFEPMMQLLGMSPTEVITAATKTSAECLGLDKQLGTVEAGKLADIIVVDGDPLTNMSVLKERSKIQIVMKEGQIAARRGI